MFDDFFEGIGELIAMFFIDFLPEIADSIEKAIRNRKEKRRKQNSKKKEKVEIE